MSRSYDMNGKRLIEFLEKVFEFSKETLEKWSILQSEYKDVIEIITDNERFAQFVTSMNDKDAAKVFKAILILSTISGKLAKLMELGDEEFKEIRSKIDLILKTLKEEH